MKKYINGQYVEMTAEEISEMQESSARAPAASPPIPSPSALMRPTACGPA